MNTLAHLVIELATLGCAAPRRYTAVIALGALLPDPPILLSSIPGQKIVER